MNNNFVPTNKLTKKAQKAIHNRDRRDWGDVKPYTRVHNTKKAYSRKNAAWKKEAALCY